MPYTSAHTEWVRKAAYNATAAMQVPMIAPMRTPEVSSRTGSTAVVTKELSAVAGRMRTSTRRSGTASAKSLPKTSRTASGAAIHNAAVTRTAMPTHASIARVARRQNRASPLLRAMRGRSAKPIGSSMDCTARTRRSPAEYRPSDAASSTAE